MAAVSVSLRAIGRARHSFRLIQMPGNLLEITGLSAAPAMQQAGLNVSSRAWLYPPCFLDHRTV